VNIDTTKGDERRITSRASRAGSFLASLPALAGCAHGPEYSIFGSFFPVWIFCSVLGLALAAGARTLLGRTPLAEYIAAPVLCYLCMAIFFACILWLPFYS
jgi:hypothetical protein